MTPAIGILGADAGALALALACHKAGIAVQLELPEPDTRPRGVGLSPNATRVLRALGCLEAVQCRASIPRAEHRRSAGSGLLIASLPLGQFALQRYGAPFLQLREAELTAALREQVRERQIPVRDRSASAGLQVRCEPSPPSGIRPPPGGGDTGAPRIWHGIVGLERVPEVLRDAVRTRWLGAGAMLHTCLVDTDRAVYFRLVVTDARRCDPDPASLAASLADWHDAPRSLVAAARECWLEPAPGKPPERWHADREVLLGQAAHPTAGYVDQATALAIEDAWVLARMLDNYEAEPAEGIAEYVRYRRPRAHRVLEAARHELEEDTLSAPMARLRRNLRLGFASRYLPELALQRVDRTYRYDCVKGFH